MKEQQEKLVGEGHTVTTQDLRISTLKSRSADKRERDGHTVTSQDLRISTLKSRSADKRERDIQSPVRTSGYPH
jgi:hypothetical protein